MVSRKALYGTSKHIMAATLALSGGVLQSIASFGIFLPDSVRNELLGATLLASGVGAFSGALVCYFATTLSSRLWLVWIALYLSIPLFSNIFIFSYFPIIGIILTASAVLGSSFGTWKATTHTHVPLTIR